MKTRSYSPYEDHTDVRLFFSRTKNVVWRLTATLLGTPRAALILHDRHDKVLIHGDMTSSRHHHSAAASVMTPSRSSTSQSCSVKLRSVTVEPPE